jgi:hypothetical protein
MKKMFFSAVALVAFSASSFAGEVKEVKKEKVKREVITITLHDKSTLDKDLIIKEGSIQYKDNCGKTYTVYYSCNYDCSNADVKAKVDEILDGNCV